MLSRHKCLKIKLLDERKNYNEMRNPTNLISRELDEKFNYLNEKYEIPKLISRVLLHKFFNDDEN